MKTAGRARQRQPVGRLDADEAFIALLIGAMDANEPVAPEEARSDARHCVTRAQVISKSPRRISC